MSLNSEDDHSPLKRRRLNGNQLKVLKKKLTDSNASTQSFCFLHGVSGENHGTTGILSTHASNDFPHETTSSKRREIKKKKKEN
jgi:hypothetical protein